MIEVLKTVFGNKIVCIEKKNTENANGFSPYV